MHLLESALTVLLLSFVGSCTCSSWSEALNIQCRLHSYVRLHTYVRALEFASRFSQVYRLITFSAFLNILFIKSTWRTRETKPLKLHGKRCGFLHHMKTYWVSSPPYIRRWNFLKVNASHQSFKVQDFFALEVHCRSNEFVRCTAITMPAGTIDSYRTSRYTNLHTIICFV